MPKPVWTPPEASGGRGGAIPREVRPTLPSLKPLPAKKLVKYPLSIGQRSESRDRGSVPWLKTCRDGREIILTSNPQGWKEYRQRVRLMLERQEGACCLSRLCPTCPGALRIEEAVFEHQFGRGMGAGKRDDRIVDSEGLPINGAAHWQCNRWKASQSMDYGRE